MSNKKQFNFNSIPFIFKIIGCLLLVLLVVSFFNSRDSSIQRMRMIQSDIEDARDEAQQAKEDAESAKEEAVQAKEDAETQRLLRDSY